MAQIVHVHIHDRRGRDQPSESNLREMAANRMAELKRKIAASTDPQTRADYRAELITLARRYGGGGDQADPELAARRGPAYAQLHARWNALMNERTATSDPTRKADLMRQINALEEKMRSA